MSALPGDVFKWLIDLANIPISSSVPLTYRFRAGRCVFDRAKVFTVHVNKEPYNVPHVMLVRTSSYRPGKIYSSAWRMEVLFVLRSYFDIRINL